MRKTKFHFANFGWSILFFLIANIGLSPVSYYLDQTSFQPFRGPLFEESLKYGLFIFYLRNNIAFSPFHVAISIGCAESINNVALGYYQNFPELSRMMHSEGYAFGISVLIISALIKLFSSVLVHYLTFRAGMLVLHINVYVALLVSVITHMAINHVVLSMWN